MGPLFCALFLVAVVKGESHVEDERKVEDCLEGDEASWAIKKWILTELDDSQTFYKDFYETVVSLVINSEYPSWYIVSGGYQGTFYYENGKDPNGERTGAYLYPDYSTAIVGVWRDHLLVSGRTTHLVEACRSGNAWTLKFGELEGPIMTYSPPSHYSIGVQPLQRDPYEVRTLEVKSSLLPGAEDGLFTKRNLETGNYKSSVLMKFDERLKGLF